MTPTTENLPSGLLPQMSAGLGVRNLDKAQVSGIESVESLWGQLSWLGWLRLAVAVPFALVL